MLARLLIVAMISGLGAAVAALALGLSIWGMLLAYALGGMLALLAGGALLVLQEGRQAPAGFAGADMQPIPLRSRS